MENFIFGSKKEDELMQKCLQVFLKNGLHKVTMDVLSKELNVSKKTIYKFVKNRKELILKTTQLQIHNDQKYIKNILQKELNAVEESYELSMFSVATLQNIHIDLHKDLQERYLKSWELWLKHQEEFMFNVVLNNLQKGIDEGLYHADLNKDIIAKIYISKIDLVFNGELFNSQKHSFTNVFLTFMDYHLKAITTPKGRTEMTKLNFKQLPNLIV